MRLRHRNVFILPTRAGFAFAALLVLMLLGAINYQNSLVFGLTFLLASMATVAIAHTYRNLAGLTVEGLDAPPVFAGEHALFGIHVERPAGRGYPALVLGWPGEVPTVLDLLAHTSETVRLPHLAERRGWLRPRRLRIETTYPLGLLRAWTWLDLGVRCVVYPRPIDDDVPWSPVDAGGERGETLGDGHDDFLGMRAYRPGDSLRQIAWKHFARDGELMVKTFGAHAERRTWLDWDALPGADAELRLSRLAGGAVRLERRGELYGLRLPGRILAPDHGRPHRDAVLRALALFGLDEAPAGAGEGREREAAVDAGGAR